MFRLRKALFPNCQPPCLLGAKINSLVTASVEIDFKSGTVNYNLVWQAPDQARRERVFFAKTLALVQGVPRTQTSPNMAAVMDRRSNNGRLTSRETPQRIGILPWNLDVLCRDRASLHSVRLKLRKSLRCAQNRMPVRRRELIIVCQAPIGVAPETRTGRCSVRDRLPLKRMAVWLQMPARRTQLPRSRFRWREK